MEIQKLTISERILLAEALWDSIAKDDAEIQLTESQKHELDKRLAAFDADNESGSDWQTVKERILSQNEVSANNQG